jgi:hypothetical protein
MVLFKTNDFTKTLKTLREGHKGQTIANIAFLDWDKGKDERCEERIKDLSWTNVAKAAKKATSSDSWRFASVDSAGRVLVSGIMPGALSYFGSLADTKMELPIETQENESRFFSLSARFASDDHP